MPVPLRALVPVACRLLGLVLGASVVERSSSNDARALEWDRLFDAPPPEPPMLPPLPPPAPARRGRQRRELRPAVPIEELSTGPEASLERGFDPPAERIVQSELRGTVQPEREAAGDVPYFTCERDCVSYLPELRVSAPKDENGMTDTHRSLNADPVHGPRVPCIVNWEVWLGVGDPGCKVEDLGGADCGPDSPFELMLLETCARHCVQKFAVDHGCTETPNDCKPTWTLRGYDHSVTCERRCDWCQPDAEDEASDTCSKTGSTGFAKTAEKLGLVLPAREVPPIALQLLHRGLRRADPDASKAWHKTLQDLADQGTALSEAVVSMLPPKERLTGEWDEEVAEWLQASLALDVRQRLDDLAVTGKPQKLPIGAGGHLIHSPAAEYCPCECTRFLRQPTSCVNTWVQARGTPGVTLPMMSPQCVVRVAGGSGAPVAKRPAAAGQPPPRDEAGAPLPKTPRKTEAAVVAELQASLPREVRQAAERAQREFAKRREFASEQTVRANMPTLKDQLDQPAAKDAQHRWMRDNKLFEMTQPLQGAQGAASPFSAVMMNTLFSPANGIATAEGRDGVEDDAAAEGFDVRPLSAAESCWCQGAVRQPQAFMWSNYYAEYYTTLRDCTRDTCALCRLMLRSCWFRLNSGDSDCTAGELCKALLESDLGLEASPKNTQLCLGMFEDLKDNELGIKQAISWEMTTWMQSAAGMTFLHKKEGEEVELDKHWEQFNKLIVLGQRNSCVQLGCCYFAE